jgi:excisionase family DNA binding protein
MDSLQLIEQKLANIENSLVASKEVLTFDETALFTGFSKSYLYKLTSAGIIPHSKPNGKNLFFDRAKVQEWLLGKPVKTLAEINTQAANYVTLKTGRR